MTIHFRDSKDFTLGVELEIQLIDKISLELAQKSNEVLELLKDYESSIKHELMLSNLEIISNICPDIKAAEEDLKTKLAVAMKAAASQGVILSLASTHPFSRWKDQMITEDPRYNRLKEGLQMVARRFNIFGLHVHVGVNGGEKCIYIMNKLLYYLPHLLAISTSSPFWEGENSGLKSYRTKVFESLPIAGLPFYFHDWHDYETLVKNYLSTKTIQTMRELWWDVRPHPDFGTIEVRICDIPSTIKETLVVTALIQALVKKFSDEYDEGMSFERPHSAITRENKWRACRYGIEGEFIVEDGTTTVPARTAIEGLVKSVANNSKELGSTEYLDGVQDILDQGTGAERQLAVWNETGDLKSVVEHTYQKLASEVNPGAGEP